MREFAKFPAEPWLRQRVGELGLAMGLGLAFALIGPFDTDQSDFLPSLGYWAGLLACWFVVAAFVERGLQKLSAYRSAKLWERRASLVTVASLPMLFAVAPATAALNGFDLTFPEVVEMYLKIVLIASGVVVLADGILGPSTTPFDAQAPFDRTEAVHAPPAPIELEPAPKSTVKEGEAPLVSRLTTRLPPNLQGPIVCLEMEDHYVRVHTSRGSALLLMRLGDAIFEAAPTPGAQTHRSWWVAASSIEGFERAGRTGRLRLSNGLTAPVSQRYLQSVQALAETARKTV